MDTSTLQDGIRIVLSKAEQIDLRLPDPRDEVGLRKALQRPDTWKIPAPITALSAQTAISEPLPPDVLAQIYVASRALSSRRSSRPRPGS
jgi:hypothetical protein